MTQNRVLNPTERQAVLDHIKPTGGFEAPPQRSPFGVPAIAWEDRLGNLDEWRKHQGMGRAIVPVLANRTKTQSVQNSVVARLNKLFPDESWSTYIEGDHIFLKFGGEKQRRHRTSQTDETVEVDGLFATG